MDFGSTNVFDLKNINDILVKETLLDAIDALEERGYNSVNQIVGYLISGDSGYISNYKETRKKISKLDRADILEVLLRNYVEKQ